MSWIHIDDICKMYLHAIKNETMVGVYNAAAPIAVHHRAFMFSLRSVINKISILIPVPSFLLNIIMGEQKAIVINSANVSANKVIQSGYEFLFTNLDIALDDIYAK